MQAVTNRLAEIRKKSGIAAATLAKLAGVSRQTVYAIEAGTYIPNTEVALRLARALDVAVEELFSLPESETPAKHATLLSASEELRPKQPVRLCEVHGRLIAAPSLPVAWYLPASDAVVSGKSSFKGRVDVQVSAVPTNFTNRILIAGCDPAMTVLAQHLQPAGIELVVVHRNSSEALALLKDGCIHIAGTHLKRRPRTSSSLAVISFAVWEEGLITAYGNPKQITSIESLARKDVTLVNRDSGSGSRLLLDAQLKRLKLDSTRVRGYDRHSPGHLAAAWEVKTGCADCCVATEAAALVFGLNFIPLVSSRYDLVVRKQDLDLPQIQTLFDALQHLNFRRKLKNIGGYDTAVTGQRVMWGVNAPEGRLRHRAKSSRR
ncbi:MAG TPA: substrate-binding domain-containing protein [Bryobacteraceae bacterium]|nr:substrate-binding domain-containing protein [Bryobacteraceae bacterium]